MYIRKCFGRLKSPDFKGLWSAQDGVTIIEFALIAPALLVMLLGAFDVAHTLYMQSVLQGAVQKAARDGSMETAAGELATPRDTIDDRVRAQVSQLHRHANIQISRRFYRTFSAAAAAKAEPIKDLNGNGQCDFGEKYVDENNNNTWDKDGGDDIKVAGARDNVVYRVNVSYPRLFPLDKLIGGSGTTSLSAATVLSNQPYGDQGKYGLPTTRDCL